MKCQSLLALAALGSGTLALPAWPGYFTNGDNGDIPPFPLSTGSRYSLTGVVPTGVFPTGIFPTGHPKPSGPRGTGHHKSVYPTSEPILSERFLAVPSMPSYDPTRNSFTVEHGSISFISSMNKASTVGPQETESPIKPSALSGIPINNPKINSFESQYSFASSTTDSQETGAPTDSKRDIAAPYPSDSTGAFSTGYRPHKTGGFHRPTGVAPTGAQPTEKPEGYPKYSKQY